MSKYSDGRIEHVRDGLWTGWNWNHIYNVPRYIQLQTKGKPYAYDAEYEQYKFNLQYHLIEFISEGIVVDYEYGRRNSRAFVIIDRCSNK